MLDSDPLQDIYYTTNNFSDPSDRENLIGRSKGLGLDALGSISAALS
jgi:hypothetical protein